MTDIIEPKLGFQSGTSLLLRRLYRQIPFPDNKHLSAITETEWPTEGDTWFWADDNAKVLELLACPDLWSVWRDEASSILRFIDTLCDGPFIFRRLSLPRLDKVQSDTGNDTFIHSLLDVSFDGPHGILTLGMRFHDGRSGRQLTLTGNYVEFIYRGTSYVIDVEAAIDEKATSHQGSTLVLRHSSDLRFEHGVRTLRLGRVTYQYTIRACSMLVDVDVSLDLDRSNEVEDVILTVGHDNLSHGDKNVHYGSIVFIPPNEPAQRFDVGKAGETRLNTRGSTYYALVQDEIAGFALAVHTIPREPSWLETIIANVRESPHLHWVVARYPFPGHHRGGTLVVGEQKVVTVGGLYDRPAEYVRILRRQINSDMTTGALLDLSISYDYGVEINAFAKCFATLSRQPSLGSDEVGANHIHKLFDCYLTVYIDNFVARHRAGKNAVFSRQLAFVIMGVTTMLRTTADEKYRSHLSALCDVMLSFEHIHEGLSGQQESGFRMGIAADSPVYMDCHSAALLAFTHAASHLDDPRLAAAIDRGLGIYTLATHAILFERKLHKADLVAVSWVDNAGMRQTNNSFWNYQAGLTLRFFNALRMSPDKRLQEILTRHQERIEILEYIIRRQITKSTYSHVDGVEVRSSYLSTETNSETQPWVLLGLHGHPYD
jgi:hypothetical protein